MFCFVVFKNFVSSKSRVKIIFILQVIDSLEAEDAASIRISQELFNKQGVAHQLAYIQCNFSILPKAITKLESQGLTLSQNLEVLAEVKTAISNADSDQTGPSPAEDSNQTGLCDVKQSWALENGRNRESPQWRRSRAGSRNNGTEAIGHRLLPGLIVLGNTLTRVLTDDFWRWKTTYTVNLR
ncbi:hypothetical protein DdX_19428 [Ditylenchus destructor]|uniref:Uncharacterized protein n=1 Tax=Ditylenchus destructor TaxID=166010 RepID=A0AAD4MIV3_9BILA|nr:hypothetical protein DdX_19428 [Ditylenchus destructor]